MDKQLAKKLNMTLTNEYWPYFEEYVKQELDRAYVKFDNLRELHAFSAIQSEIRVLKQMLNLKESVRLSMEN